MVTREDVLKELDKFGGIATTRDVGEAFANVLDVGKCLNGLRKRGEITSIQSAFRDGGVGNTPNIWIRYYDFETRPLP